MARIIEAAHDEGNRPEPLRGRPRSRRVIDGDFDFDCRVDIADLIDLATRFGAGEGDPLYERAFDIDRDGVIDSRDLDALAVSFGKSS